MKFALTSYGTRGDVEPFVAVGRELVSRGHQVSMAVSPDQVAFAESAGLTAVGYGPDPRRWQSVHREVLHHLTHNFWQVRDLIKRGHEDWELITQFWQDAEDTMTSVARDADLLFTGPLGEETAVNVAEYYGIPMATMHYFPLRPNGQMIRALPPSVGRTLMSASEWVTWPLAKRLDGPQRRRLGLPKATGPASRRPAQNRSLEIQAYDEACFPGLAAEWAKFDGRRPFVGALTIEQATDDDAEVASWISEGAPPIFFGFGSMPVESAADTLDMITTACAELGERALVGSGWSDFGHLADVDHVKVVGAINYAAAFPACRAVVHHGGVGTTAAGLRAGVPTLVLSTWADQNFWADQVKRLKVGYARRFSDTTRETLVADLRRILTPEYAARARDFAARMTPAAESVAAAADVLQDFVRLKAVG
ncbi:glycosyltransferase [Mycolicibacterium sp. 120270]|uniref:glycosyltransferase n=1 Tax=Mycolicibacterium sp. 120270 TaxID=3090600 RepID=UPI00299DC931|nr:nucleotide disphospho-sugar-binding domain-containing protein [Mycolicibacterium sp. 120270]MDX1883975.1 glycosyltransferase [Mycolicibacterium sp. 120270]